MRFGIAAPFLAGAVILILRLDRLDRVTCRVEGLNGAISVPETLLGGPEHISFFVGGVPPLLNDERFQAILPDLEWLPRLSSLDLEGTQITDTGLRGISSLKGLTRLDLSNTAVSDASISEIAAPRESLF